MEIFKLKRRPKIERIWEFEAEMYNLSKMIRVKFRVLEEKVKSKKRDDGGERKYRVVANGW